MDLGLWVSDLGFTDFKFVGLGIIGLKFIGLGIKSLGYIRCRVYRFKIDVPYV